VRATRARISATSMSARRNKFKDYKPSFSNGSDESSFKGPLQRFEELGTRSFGVILDFEALFVRNSVMTEREDWIQIAMEQHFQQPVEYQFQLSFRRKPEHVIAQIFNWSTDPACIKLLTKRKSEIYFEKTLRVCTCDEMTLSFLKLLQKYKIRCAVYSSQLSYQELAVVLNHIQIQEFFYDNLRQSKPELRIAGRDSVAFGLPDYELYWLAAELVRQRPMKCIVVSDNHLALEATADLGMKCIVVTTEAQFWELRSADMVISSLHQLSFRNLQNLFSLDVYN